MLDIPEESKLGIRHIIRISKYLNKSIFDKNECSIWQGYIIIQNREYSCPFVNIYFKHKKVNLHRLLFINYKDSLKKDEYIKFICENPGKCCNINHMMKFKFHFNKKEELENSGMLGIHKENKKKVKIENIPQTLYFD